MSDTIISLYVDEGGRSQSVAVSTTSAQSAVINARQVIITPSVDVFVRSGTNPTALSNGTDMLLLGGFSYRVKGFATDHKLAFITASGTGTVYITPTA